VEGPVVSGGRTTETRTGAHSEERFSGKLRPLFVGGCQRSGTTAFADYLNRHPRIVVCQERYKRINRKRITPDLFTFERILDYRLSETNKPWNLDYYRERHAEILARKDPAELRWIGDKNPGFVKDMGLLEENNPGARFIMLYRPVEEVAESWDARSRDESDHWLTGENGFELGVQTWNTAMRKMREYVEASPVPRVLVVGYHDFFYRNASCVPLISRFLDVEFGASVTDEWAAMSERFEGERRQKRPLDEEELAFIRQHADREAEAWVLGRIERQWTEPGLYVNEDREVALTALDEMEARAWRLAREAQQLEKRLAEQTRTIRRLKRRERETAQSPPRGPLSRAARRVEVAAVPAARRLLAVPGRLRQKVLGSWRAK
jgi:uncharacterized protein YhbP (UPF0306 family)